VVEPGRQSRTEIAIDYGVALDTPPMEARAAEVLPDGNGGWQYEPKWDGFRCLAFKSGAAVEIRAKSGKPLGRYFPEMVALLTSIPADRFVVDGELVIDIDGTLSFDATAGPASSGRQPHPQTLGRDAGAPDPV